MSQTPEERSASLIELGLEKNEVAYLTAAFKALDKDQRAIALAIWDKRNNLIASANDEYKVLKAAEEAAKGEEAELDEEYTLHEALHGVVPEGDYITGALDAEPNESRN